MSGLVHSVSKSVLVEEVTWTVQEQGLRCHSSKTDVDLAYKDVERIQLEWSPSRFDPAMYQCHLKMRGGGTFTIHSSHYRGFADFEDRSETYLPLVMDVLRRVDLANPTCGFFGGKSRASYFGNAALIGLSFVLLFVVLLFLPVDWFGLVAIKFVIVLLGIPLLWGWFKTNWPREMPLRQALAEQAVNTWLPVVQP